MRRPAALVALGASAAVALPASLAGADSITPIVLTIKIAPVARLHAPLKVTVGVKADPFTLDAGSPIRARVKLASECGGTYQYTTGTVLLDKRLSPQPADGHSYTGSATGSGKPAAYGVQTVCVWIEEEGDNRDFATDQSITVNVSRPCTVAAAHYDKVRRHGRPAAVRAAKRAAARACGPGVPL